MTGVSRTVVQGGATTQAYTAGSIGAVYAAPATPLTAAPRTATFANTVPTLGSINTGMQVIGSSSVVPRLPMTTTTTGYAGGPQQVNQAQMAYNMQIQGLNTAIQLEQTIEKQLDSLKPSKEAMEKRKKARDLENKRFELQKLEREMMGLKVDPQVQRSHDRQKFVKEQKIAALKAQVAVAKFDAGQIDGDGKEIKAPAPELMPYLNDPDVQKLIKEKQAKPADKEKKADDKGEKKDDKKDKEKPKK